MLLLLRVPSTGDRVGAIDPPISQGLVAAAVRARGLEANVLDLTWAGEAGLDLLLTILHDSGIRVVGMTVYQTNIERCLKISALIRHVRPDVKILMGGPQITHMPPAGLASMPTVDALCRGPAEQVLPNYLESLTQDHLDVRGFFHQEGDHIVDGGRPPALARYDDLASPFEHRLWPLDRYPFVVMFSSRGCPYGCAFCYTPASSNRFVSYSPYERVVRDVTLVAEAGARHVFFADPIFVADRTRTLALLRILRDVRPGVPMSCELRMESVDLELLRAMGEAGFVKVAYGLETANPKVLEGVRKSTDLARFREVVELTLAHGIAVEAFFMYGLPGESFEDVLRTFDFIESLQGVVGELSEPQQMQLYFGTELLEHHQRYGIEILGHRPAYLSPGKSYRTRTLGPEEFLALEEEWNRRRRLRRETGSGALETESSARTGRPV